LLSSRIVCAKYSEVQRAALKGNLYISFMKRLPFLAGFLAVLAFAVNCTPELSNPEPQAGECNFSHCIAIGGDYMAGYQDGALTDNGQRHSIPALLNRQFAEYLGGSAYYFSPVYSGFGLNSKPWESPFVGPSHLGDRVDCEGTVSLGPIKDSVAASVAASMYANAGSLPNNNFSVPFARFSDYTVPAFGSAPNAGMNPYYHHMASAPGTSTLLGDAVNANATFFSAWIGMEDIYEYARNGGEGATIAPASTFGVYLDTILASLTANGAKGVIANIPDFRYMPYYTLVPWNGAEMAFSTADSLNDIYDVSGLTHIRFHEGHNAFVINDQNAPSGVRQIRRNEYITLGVPLDSMKCNFMGILFSTVPDRYVLDSSEVAFIDMNIAAYNAVIAQKAAQYGLAFVDANGFFRSVHTGMMWDGVTFSTTFVSGGFFSLDGYHPNQKGYSLLANEFVYAINARYGATVPTVNCFECDGVLFP
jgi:hypothetical protein